MKEYIIRRNELSNIMQTVIDLYSGEELIRCKDCKYYKGSDKNCVNGMYARAYGYCHLAERK